MTRSRTAGALALLAMVTAAAGVGGAAPQRALEKQHARLRIVLVGDSTVTDEKGWGLGLRRFLTDSAELVNAAASGRSSKSYLDEGRWAQALTLKGDYYLIQFGHNDEPGKGPDRETDPATTFTANVARFVDEVRAMGATPVLVTSLARRSFDANGRLTSTLTPYVAAVTAVAKKKQVPIVDLNASSTALVEQLGATEWAAMSPRMPSGEVDTTHLNTKGSVAVARLVASELRRAVSALGGVLRVDPSGMAVVAKDGTGDFTTVTDAVNASPQNSTSSNPWVIYIKAGTYRELVYIQREKRFLELVGEDPVRTVITYDLNANSIGPEGKPIGTFRTPTVTIDADDFTAENLTFENAAGPVGQAVAVRVDGDRVAFRNSRFLGWQDTLLLNRGRHYIERSFIAGHVNFIFGGATAFFDRCVIHAWRDGYITAASTPAGTRFGFVFADSRITGASKDVRTYLGRPWRDYAQVSFLRTEMTEVVRPEGWHNWDRPEREKTARYREFGNTGPGAAASGRVRWMAGLPPREAAAIAPLTVVAGADGWDPRAPATHPSLANATDLPVPAPPGPTRP